MLPGMYIGSGMATGARTLVFGDSVIDNADGNPNAPTVSSGDLIIAVGYGGGLGTTATPTGYTQVARVTSGPECIIVCKVSDGTETGFIDLWGTNPSDGDHGVSLALTGGLSSLGSIVDSTIESSFSKPTNQTLNVSTLGVKPFVAIAVYGASGPVDPRGFSGATEDGEVGDSDLYLKWKFYPEGASASDITVSMDDEGSQVLASAIIEVNF